MDRREAAAKKERKKTGNKNRDNPRTGGGTLYRNNGRDKQASKMRARGYESYTAQKLKRALSETCRTEERSSARSVEKRHGPQAKDREERGNTLLSKRRRPCRNGEGSQREEPWG